MTELSNEIKVLLDSAKEASKVLAVTNSNTKNEALQKIADKLRSNAEKICLENQKDVENAQKAGKTDALIDRLTLTPERVEAMSKGLEEIISLTDPVGEVFDTRARPNGLQVSKMRIPIGVIGIVFESRPNVVADAGALCLKSGNAVILRGGSEASYSNNILGKLIGEAISEAGLPKACVQVMTNTDRKLVLELLQARGLVDLVIPRGGEGLIRFVDENAKVPIILHYKGVCHVYIDEFADLEKAVNIAENAKVQRPGVCNAMETLLVHNSIAKEFLEKAYQVFTEKKVELRGCERTVAILKDIKQATNEDWPMEYLDLVLSVKIVDDLDDAVKHIDMYGSGHSEAIVTENYTNSGRFIKAIQSSCVLVNASTRFNDGGELGLGAEIGISTTKLHAYGPMGLTELTTSKFVVLGNGQVRS